MDYIIQISIGLGLIISLFFSEFLGLAAGGMVVPGYFALNITDPIKVLTTLFLGYVTYLFVRFMSFFLIIYGRRRTVLMILVGFLFGAIVRNFISLEIESFAINLNIIGYIIPGLIATWIDRQGIIETFSTLMITSTLVRMILILINKGEIIS